MRYLLLIQTDPDGSVSAGPDERLAAEMSSLLQDMTKAGVLLDTGGLRPVAEATRLRLANGEQIDIQEHALLCSTLARLASRIGIERRARDVTTLADYLQQHQGTAE